MTNAERITYLLIGILSAWPPKLFSRIADSEIQKRKIEQENKALRDQLKKKEEAIVHISGHEWLMNGKKAMELKSVLELEFPNKVILVSPNEEGK